MAEPMNGGSPKVAVKLQAASSAALEFDVIGFPGLLVVTIMRVAAVASARAETEFEDQTLVIACLVGLRYRQVSYSAAAGVELVAQVFVAGFAGGWFVIPGGSESPDIAVELKVGQVTEIEEDRPGFG